MNRPALRLRHALTGLATAAIAMATTLAVATPALADPADPVGSFDSATSPAPGQIKVTGWVVDPDVPTEPVHVGIQIGNITYSSMADQPRPDVAAEYPAYGANHGFSFTIDTTEYGSISMEGFALNKPGTGGVSRVSLGTRTVTVKPASPRGKVELVKSPRPGVVRVRGWAFDPNKPNASVKVFVHFYKTTKSRRVHQSFTIPADKIRKDIARKHGVGKRHGFDVNLATTMNGTFRVWVVARNLKNTAGRNTEIDSRQVKVRKHNGSPSGWASAIPSFGRVVVWGAAWDPNDYQRPVLLRTLITKGTARESHDFWATNVDHQVGKQLSGTADRHGFRQAWKTKFRGKVRVRTYAFNRIGKGSTTLLRDRVVTVD